VRGRCNCPRGRGPVVWVVEPRASTTRRAPTTLLLASHQHAGVHDGEATMKSQTQHTFIHPQANTSVSFIPINSSSPYSHLPVFLLPFFQPPMWGLRPLPRMRYAILRPDGSSSINHIPPSPLELSNLTYARAVSRGLFLPSGAPSLRPWRNHLSNFFSPVFHQYIQG